MFWTTGIEQYSTDHGTGGDKILYQRFLSPKYAQRHTFARQPLQTIDHFLTKLQDGAWHSLRTLSRNFNIPKNRLETLSALLAEPKIVEYNPAKSQVKIGNRWRKLLENTDTEGKRHKTAVGTVALPPNGTVTVQGVQMTNLLKKEIEINMRLDARIREIAISDVERD